MKEDFDPLFEGNDNQNRLVKLEDMFSDSAYYYFDISEWEGMIEYYLSVLKLDKATKALSLAKIQHPNALELFLKEAELMSEKNHPSNALILLQKLELSYPSDADITILKGNIYSRFGDSYRAIKCFKNALSKVNDEDSVDLYLQLAGECLILEKSNQSVYWLKMLIKKNPENIEGLYELALIFEGEELIKDGIKFYRSFLEAQPYNHHAWFNLGNLYSIDNKLEEALEAYDYSVVSFDEFSSGWFNKGSILARLDRFEDAIECFQKTLELEGPSAHTYCNLGECTEEMGELITALDYYKRSLTYDDHFEDAIVGCANCLLELGALEEAFDYCEKGIKINAKSSSLQHIFGEVCQGLGFYKEAKRAYKKVIKLDSDNSDVFLDYSGMLWENGHFEEAIQIIESGLALNQNNAELNYRAGAYLYLTNDKISAFNRWNNAFMESPLKLNQIFDFCNKLKDDTEVVEFFEQI